MRGRLIAGAAALALVTVLGTGCGKVANKVADKATEKAIDHATGGSVDVNSSDGGVSIRTKDGSATYGNGTKLPDGWPKDLPVPDGMELHSATSSKSSGTTYLMITGTAESAEPAGMYDALKQELVDAGYTIDNDNQSTAGGNGFYGTLSGSKADGAKAQASVVAASDTKLTVSMSYSAGS